jgi:hypothetical protein
VCFAKVCKSIWLGFDNGDKWISEANHVKSGVRVDDKLYPQLLFGALSYVIKVGNCDYSKREIMVDKYWVLIFIVCALWLIVFVFKRLLLH